MQQYRIFVLVENAAYKNTCTRPGKEEKRNWSRPSHRRTSPCQWREPLRCLTEALGLMGSRANEGLAWCCQEVQVLDHFTPPGPSHPHPHPLRDKGGGGPIWGVVPGLKMAGTGIIVPSPSR